MANNRELTLILDGKLGAGLKGAAAEAQRRLQAVEKTVKQLDAAKIDSTKYSKLRTKVMETQRAFDGAQREVARLSQEMAASSSPSAKLLQQFQKATAESDRLGGELDSQRGKLDLLQRSLKAAGVSSDSFAADVSQLDRRLAAAGIEGDKLRSKLAGLANQQKRMQGLQAAADRNASKTAQARGQLLDAAGMAMALAAPIRQAMAFEDQMADVRKVVDGLNDPKALKGMADAIMDLSTKGRIPMTAEGLAQIVAAGGQMGLARKELIPFARDAAKMGIAFDTTADEAGQMMANWRTAFRMNQAEVVKLADKINYLADSTAASAAGISDVVTRIGPLGEVGGLASGQIAALGASMVSMGIQPEIAATGIKKLIVTLAAGSSATKQQNKAFAMLGLDSIKMAKRMQRDAGGALLDVFGKLRKLPKFEQTAVLKNLFGEEGLAAVSSLLPTLDQVEDNLRRVGKASNYAGSMQREFEVRSKTTSNSMQILRNRVAQMAIKLGSVLLPELIKIAEMVGPMVDKFVAWADANPELFSTLVKVGAALVAARVATLALNYGVGVLKGGVLDLAVKGLRVIQFLKLGAAGMWAFNIATKALTLAGPIGQILALVAALALITRTIREAYLAWKEWKQATAAKERSKAMDAFSADYIKRGDHSIRKLQEAQAAQRRAAGIVPAAHAAGGIVTRPTLSWVGEQGPEAIIPLANNRSRALGLWELAGAAINAGRRAVSRIEESRSQARLSLPRTTGAMAVAGAGGGGMNITFAPTLNFQGPASRDDVRSAMAQSYDEFRRMLDRYFKDERRRDVS